MRKQRNLFRAIPIAEPPCSISTRKNVFRLRQEKKTDLRNNDFALKEKERSPAKPPKEKTLEERSTLNAIIDHQRKHPPQSKTTSRSHGIKSRPMKSRNQTYTKGENSKKAATMIAT